MERPPVEKEMAQARSNLARCRYVSKASRNRRIIALCEYALFLENKLTDLTEAKEER